MKIKNILSISALLMLTACNGSNTAKTAQSTEEATAEASSEQTKTKQPLKITKKHLNVLSEFTHLTSIGSMDIIYTPGDYCMDIEGDSALISYITTEFDSNLLTVGLKSDSNTDYNFYGNENSTKLYISAPSLKCVSLCGTGDFICDSLWKEEEIQLGILGSGSATLGNIECEKMLIEATDKGNVTIGHLKANVATLNSRSSGTFTIDCDVNDFGIFNANEQTITLTGTIREKTVSNPEDKKLKDMTKRN